MRAIISGISIPDNLLKLVMRDLGFFSIFLHNNTTELRDQAQQILEQLNEGDEVPVELEDMNFQPFEGRARIKLNRDNPDHYVITLQTVGVAQE